MNAEWSSLIRFNSEGGVDSYRGPFAPGGGSAVMLGAVAQMGISGAGDSLASGLNRAFWNLQPSSGGNSEEIKLSKNLSQRSQLCLPHRSMSRT
jgi:hypothetical protein